jgi:hypothetical protein
MDTIEYGDFSEIFQKNPNFFHGLLRLNSENPAKREGQSHQAA